ncbi:MAG TPA: helix-turn-helix domain-containing protein [Myxococcaceae bacterium]|nr:helix-turn-helix domain-containing protein [Myxococcaceae bacterium]
MREECLAAQRVLRRTSDKWSCLLIASLVEGAMHFNELRRSLKGIPQWSLTRTLRGLHRDGLISRMIAPTIPSRVDYELTDLGWSLLEHLRALGAWALKEELAIQQARERFDEMDASSRMPRAFPGKASRRQRPPRVTSGS